MNQLSLFTAAPIMARPSRPDTAMLLAMSPDFVKPEPLRDACQPMPEKPLSWTLRHSCHFHAGRSMFYAGEPRELPPMFTSAKGKNPQDWFAGWDYALSEKEAGASDAC